MCVCVRVGSSLLLRRTLCIIFSCKENYIISKYELQLLCHKTLCYTVSSLTWQQTDAKITESFYVTLISPFARFVLLLASWTQREEHCESAATPYAWEGKACVCTGRQSSKGSFLGH